MFFLWLPMYCAYLNFRVWVIWASVVCSFFQKWLEIFWFIWLFDSHLSTYGNLCFGYFDFTVFVFFCYECVKVADGSIMCGCWATC